MTATKELIPFEFYSANFGGISYKDTCGRMQKAISMTRDRLGKGIIT